MTKRLLGRWKVSVKSTKWSPGPRQAKPAAPMIGLRSAPVVRAALVGLEWLGAAHSRSPQGPPRLTQGKRRPN